MEDAAGEKEGTRVRGILNARASRPCTTVPSRPEQQGCRGDERTALGYECPPPCLNDILLFGVEQEHSSMNQA
jgi:hypothetical protein